jgi:hypothetical protein
MKRERTIIPILAIFFVVFVRPLTGDTLFRFRIRTDSYIRSGQTVPAQEGEKRIWVGENKMAVLFNQNKYVVDLNDMVLRVSNDAHKTCFLLPLPLDLKKHLDAYALLRYSTYLMRFYVYDLTTGGVEKTDESRVIKGKQCIRYEKTTEDQYTVKESVWTTEDVPFDSEMYRKMNGHLQDFFGHANTAELQANMKEIKGFPIKIESVRSRRGLDIRTLTEVVDIQNQSPPAGLYEIPGGYMFKDNIGYDELVACSPGPLRRTKTKEEAEVYALLQKFQEGYLHRDISKLEVWVDDLFDTDVQIIGTHAKFPKTGEWRNGREAALQLFGSDWRNWGDVKFYPEEADISVDGPAAWVGMFATVTRKPGMGRLYRDAETIQKTMVQVMKAKLDQDDWSGLRKLYEVLHDVGFALAEYERSPEFIWPVQISLGLIKKEGRWLLKQIHFAHPSEGYPVVRLLPIKERK